MIAILFASLVSTPLSVFAQNQSNSQSAREAKQEIQYFKESNTLNSIPLLKNRFRIDAEIDEVMLLFYRRHGSPPIILVRPDGSKLKVEQLPEGKVSWFDDRSFDLIKIKKPMPGPWQAIGQIIPNSEIMVVSDVRIEVEPLPPILLQGETIKITGQLYNGDRVIDDPLFQKVANLDVDFYSSNNAAFDNFGASPVELTSFRDDGRALDEYANDAIFTGEFTLNFAPGEWLPVYYIKMPMANRELRQKAVVVQKNPISFDTRLSDDKEQPHQLIVNIDDSFVEPDTMLFQGSIIYPDKQEEQFSITEGEGISRKLTVKNIEAGLFRVKLSAFGKTKQQREFILDVPEFSFNVAMSEQMLGEMLAVNGDEVDLTDNEMADENVESMQAMPMTEPEEDDSIMMIVMLNAGLLILFSLSLGIFLFIKKRKAAKAA